jgi:tRNA/rRNA methyltransferase
MGLDGLDLVNPADFRTVEAWRMAWRSEDFLEQAREHAELGTAVAETVYVAGLVGRSGMRVDPITVRQMAAEIAALPADAPAAVVFGSESRGLTESELLLCQRRVRIPSHERQPSLNLAQAVMVAAYEIFLAGPQETTEFEIERATTADIDRAFSFLKEAMVELGFLTKENPEARFAEWREIFGRTSLTPREVRLLLALARRIRGVSRLAKRLKSS